MTIFFRLIVICCLVYSVCSRGRRPETCPPNEEPAVCMNRCQNCEDRRVPCIQIQVCTPGFNCKEGFYRNKQGNCIPEAQCDIAGCNGQNEIEVGCAKPAWCNTCGIRGNCKLKTCSKGCDCKPGFYRNDEGICIPESQCPSMYKDNCGLNMEYSRCVNICNTCETITSKSACNFLLCNEGCDCKPGYTRNNEQICIPENACPSAACGPNSKPSECASPCPPTCRDRYPYCAQVCVHGCVCYDGFIKDDSGNCILESQCMGNTG